MSSDVAGPDGSELSEGLGLAPERDARWALAADVARGRMAGGWVPVDADLVLALDARLAELAALAEAHLDPRTNRVEDEAVDALARVCTARWARRRRLPAHARCGTGGPST